MNRSIIDRIPIEAEAARRRARARATGHGRWLAKVVVIPAIVAGLINRILHREKHPVPFQIARRRAGVYVWRPTLGPDGTMTDGEIVPVSEASKHRSPIH